MNNEPRYKTCKDCDGEGTISGVGYPTLVCDTCNGEGTIEMSDDEIRFEDECIVADNIYDSNNRP